MTSNKNIILLYKIKSLIFNLNLSKEYEYLKPIIFLIFCDEFSN